MSDYPIEEEAHKFISNLQSNGEVNEQAVKATNMLALMSIAVSLKKIAIQLEEMLCK